VGRVGVGYPLHSILIYHEIQDKFCAVQFILPVRLSLAWSGMLKENLKSSSDIFARGIITAMATSLMFNQNFIMTLLTLLLQCRLQRLVVRLTFNLAFSHSK
jgi:hypothetical protein